MHTSFIWRSLYILQIYSLNSATLLNQTGATQWMSTLASGHNTSSVRSNWATFMFPHDTASQTSMIRVSAKLGFNVLDAPKHPTRKTKFRVSATLARLHGCSAAFGSSQKRFIPTLSPSTWESFNSSGLVFGAKTPLEAFLQSPPTRSNSCVQGKSHLGLFYLTSGRPVYSQQTQVKLSG